MWDQIPQICNVSSPRKPKPGSDAHGHSPSLRICKDPAQATFKMTQPAIAPHTKQTTDPYWSFTPPMSDPFVDDAKHRGYRRQDARSTSGDQSMPDYPHFITPVSIRNHSNNEVTYLGGGIGSSTESQFDELMAALSPRKNMSGTYPPANTRVSSAANTPSKETQTSTAAEARATSYSHAQARSVSVTTRDPPPPQIREPSDASMKSRFSDQNEQADAAKIKKRPAIEVKSRKEGRLNELDAASKTQPKPSAHSAKYEGNRISFSNSKRKRASSVSGSNLSLEGLGSLSPTRKVSKLEGKADSYIDLLGNEGFATRNPLGNLANIQ